MNSLARLVAFAGSVILVAASPASEAGTLKTKGLWVQFERRGWPVEYWPGQVIQQFNQFDSVVNHNVSDEVALQLDAMRAMRVNTITIELRAADVDGDFTFPKCNIHPSLGFQWPQPTSTELANLTPFLDLIHSKDVKVILVLTNTHMQEQPPTNSQTWLGAILNVVKNHPALDFVVFNGDARLVDTNGDGVPDACGIPAEAPLWLGATAVPATYVKWAINYAMSLGLSASKLSGGTIVGDYFTDSQPPCGPQCTDGHLWKPIGVLKSIFDALGVPNNQRVHALSFYEHRKCATARGLQCTDTDAASWADQTMQDVYTVIGTNNGARVVAYEMGNLTPVDPNWSTSSALANLVAVLKKYGADGGSFWRWTSFQNSEDTDPTLAQPIKLRGVTFNYTPVQATLLRAYSSPASTHDFNGDGMSDIAWRDTSGNTAVWLMNGGTVSSSGVFGAVPTSWSIVGHRDFNGDGKYDWLWRDTSGNTAIWFLNGASVSSSAGLGVVPSTWTVVGTGDFNGDGKADILWRDSSGNTAIWFMNGGLVSSSASIGVVPITWTIVGTGDFNGDGKSDILWRDTGGNTAIWFMNGSQVSSSAGLGVVPTTWTIVGTGDFNADGKSDIIWRDTTGNVAVWLMNAGQVISSSGFGVVPISWSIVETGDFNGDGTSDILWRDTGGNTAIWFMNGLQVSSSSNLGVVPTSWTIQSVNAD